MATTQQDAGLTDLVQILEKKRDEAIQDRSETEARWLRDLEQYEGNTLDRVTKGDIQHNKATQKAPPVVHLTRTRTNAIAARIINMLVPSNERSWDIEPTPVPQLMEQLRDETPLQDPDTGAPVMTQAPPPGQGQPAGPQQPQEPAAPAMGEAGAPEPRPMTQADIAREQMEEAERRAGRMRQHMDDQMVEGRFNAEQRKLIFDGCKLGTGIIEGPVVTGAFKKVRQEVGEGVWVTKLVEEPAPKFQCVDPWNFYPTYTETIEQCEGAFLDRLVNRRELQELKLQPGFDGAMIDELLQEQPTHSSNYSNALISRANVTGQTIKTDKRYALWKYVGSLTDDDLEALEIELDETDGVDPIIEVWFCQGRLLKAKRHAMEGTYRLPFLVWNYQENETSIFGYGVPYIMRDSDRVIQSTWRMILHNTALSAGPQLVRDKDAIEPVGDEGEAITGGLKQWYKTNPEKSINDAFALFQIEARTDDLAAVHDRARQNADEELAFPLVAQGEPTEAVPTHSGLALLMNASNVVQRRHAQDYDDNVLVPGATALYEWNMLYNDDASAKGDMTIRAHGATRLVVKDLQAQHLLMVADVTMNDRFAPLMDDKELLKGILKSAEVDPDTLMLSEEELANRGPSQAEQLDMQHKQAEIDKLIAETEKLAAGEPDDGSIDMKRLELMYRYDKLEADLTIAQMKLEEAAAEAADRTNVSLEKVYADMQVNERREATRLAIEKMRDRREQVAAGYKLRLEAEEQRLRRQNMERGFDTYG
jgi:hypothetical protein